MIRLITSKDEARILKLISKRKELGLQFSVIQYKLGFSRVYLGKLLIQLEGKNMLRTKIRANRVYIYPRGK